MGNLKNTFLRVWPELRQSWEFGVFVLGFVVSAAVAVVATKDPADRVRYFGTVLQIGGIALIAYGLRDLRREFNRPGVFSAMWARVVAIGKSVRPQKTVILTGVGAIGLAGTVATAYSRVGGTVDQRLDGLEREIDAIRKQADERESQMVRRIDEVRSALWQESQARKDAHAEITKRLDDFAVGGLHLEVIGLWWLLVATLATCIPEEIAKWL